MHCSHKFVMCSTKVWFVEGFRKHFKNCIVKQFYFISLQVLGTYSKNFLSSPFMYAIQNCAPSMCIFSSVYWYLIQSSRSRSNSALYKVSQCLYMHFLLFIVLDKKYDYWKSWALNIHKRVNCRQWNTNSLYIEIAARDIKLKTFNHANIC